MGLSIGEVAAAGEGDGLPDLFITHWVAQENAFYQSTLTAGSQLEYRDKTRQFRLGEISIDTVGWGTALVDLDLDGWIDLAVANGSTLERTDDGRQLIAEPAFLFWNDGERFHNVAAEAGTALSRPYSGRGLAAADFDGDGDIDLAVAVNRGRMLLLRNESPTANRSLIVTLRGRAAACFGARVQLDVKDRPQVRWWGSDVSYLSMHAPEMVFGLGKNGAADRVQVRWADGKTTVLTDVAAGRIEVAHPDAAASAKTRLADRFGKEHR